MKEDYSIIIRKKRELLGLSRKDFSHLLDLGSNGERTVIGWENGEHTPSNQKRKIIEKIKIKASFKDRRKSHKFTFIDLFAGIGGMRIPFQEIGGKAVFSSDIDKHVQKTYAANFGEIMHGDIIDVNANSIPDHDILLAGFPCQAFSQAGKKEGFMDTRGTMFFEIQRILAHKQPKAFLLENVKQLKGHDNGQTLRTIIGVLQGRNKVKIPKNIPMSAEARAALSRKLNYWVDWRVLKATDFGLPQNRQRVFIIGFDRKYFKDIDFEFRSFQWPKPVKHKTRVGDIMERKNSSLEKYTISTKLWDGHKRRKKYHKSIGNGFGYGLFNRNSPYTNTISARYYKDGSEILIDQSDIGKNPRLLTLRECANLQGFPNNFIVNVVSETQSYKQFGNAVPVNIVRSIAKKMIDLFKDYSLIEK